MRYGVHVNSGSSVTDPAVLRDMAQLAEDLGFSTILIGDHVVPARQIQTPFPLKIDNPPWAVYQEHDWPDCFVTLAYLAAATQTLRLGTSVILLPYRHPCGHGQDVRHHRPVVGRTPDLRRGHRLDAG